MKVIRFRSTPENWFKEYHGLKKNTVRKGDWKSDIRFEILRDFKDEVIYFLEIEIENTKTHEVFKRKVSDVTLWEGIYIISWL